MKSASPKILDVSAVGLSGLCMAHCLALPVLALSVPVAGLWAEASWFHPLCIAIAAPLTLAAMADRRLSRGEGSRIGLTIAGLGLLLLALALLSGPGLVWERVLTVLGGALLAGGHVMNWRRRRALSVRL